jgi:hypothetical protein
MHKCSFVFSISCLSQFSDVIVRVPTLHVHCIYRIQYCAMNTVSTSVISENVCAFTYGTLCGPHKLHVGQELSDIKLRSLNITVDGHGEPRAGPCILSGQSRERHHTRTFNP